MKRGVTIGVTACVVLLLLAVGMHQAISQPDAPRPATTAADLGLLLLDTDTGVYVLAVREGSPADYAGISPGDRLCSAGGKPFSTMAELDELLCTAVPDTQMQLRRGTEDLITLRLRLE